MLRRLYTLLVPAVVLAFASHTWAAYSFTVNITNDQEPGNVTPTTTTGQPRSSFGTALFTVNDAETEMSMSATITGIDFGPADARQTADTNDDLTAAHIHAGNNVPPATNGVVWGFIGTPFHNTNPNDTVITPFASGAGATVTAVWNVGEGTNGGFAGNLHHMHAGREYVNFHTNQFPGGEIRGALPEPGSVLALFGLGSLALTRTGRRPQ